MVAPEVPSIFHTMSYLLATVKLAETLSTLSVVLPKEIGNASALLMVRVSNPLMRGYRPASYTHPDPKASWEPVISPVVLTEAPDASV